MKESSDLLSLLNGELSAVCFVRDYVELHFDGPIVRLMGQIALEANGARLKFGADENFHSVLCSVISSELVDIHDSKETGLRFEFTGGVAVGVKSDKAGAEYAHFISYPENRMFVWEDD